MKKYVKLLILLALSTALVLGIMIQSASAVKTVASGKCGTNLT